MIVTNKLNNNFESSTHKAQQSTSDLRIIQNENVAYDMCKLCLIQCGSKQDIPRLDRDLRNTFIMQSVIHYAWLKQDSHQESSTELNNYVCNKRERATYLDILYCHSAGIHLGMCSHRTPQYWCSLLPGRHYYLLNIRWYLQASVQVRSKQTI